MWPLPAAAQRDTGISNRTEQGNGQSFRLTSPFRSPLAADIMLIMTTTAIMLLDAAVARHAGWARCHGAAGVVPGDGGGAGGAAVVGRICSGQLGRRNPHHRPCQAGPAGGHRARPFARAACSCLPKTVEEAELAAGPVWARRPPEPQRGQGRRGSGGGCRCCGGRGAARCP